MASALSQSVFCFTMVDDILMWKNVYLWQNACIISDWSFFWFFSDSGSDSNSDSEVSVIRIRQNKTFHPFSNYSEIASLKQKTISYDLHIKTNLCNIMNTLFRKIIHIIILFLKYLLMCSDIDDLWHKTLLIKVEKMKAMSTLLWKNLYMWLLPLNNLSSSKETPSTFPVKLQEHLNQHLFGKRMEKF